MRDLTTIAAQERETRTALRDLRLSIQNKRDSLARDEQEEAKLLEFLDTLEAEARAAFVSARGIGLPAPEPEQPLNAIFGEPSHADDRQPNGLDT